MGWIRGDGKDGSRWAGDEGKAGPRPQCRLHQGDTDEEEWDADWTGGLKALLNGGPRPSDPRESCS